MNIAALILSIIALGFSMYLFVEHWAQKKSQHIIQYIDPMSGTMKPEQNADAIQQQDFTEFDMTDPAAMAINELKRRK